MRTEIFAKTRQTNPLLLEMDLTAALTDILSSENTLWVLEKINSTKHYLEVQYNTAIYMAQSQIYILTLNS